MTPFQLDVEIRTPLAGGDIPTLDAILLGEMARMDPDSDDYAAGPEAALAKLRSLLKITPCGIPHASALLFDARTGQGNTSKINGRRRELWEVGPLGLKVKKRRGVFRASDSIYNNSTESVFRLKAVRSAKFFGVGDLQAIRLALSFWQGIGAQWRNGWGELAGSEGDGWELTELSADGDKTDWWGLVDERRAPVRPLPIELFGKLGGDGGAFPVRYRRAAPPYWRASTPRVAVVVPDGRQRASARYSAAKTGMPTVSPMDFLLSQFARRMQAPDELRKAEEQGGKEAALLRAIAPNYRHRGGKSDLRIDGCRSLFVAAGDRVRLFSDVIPQGEGGAKFEARPSLKHRSAEWQKILYDSAMAEVNGLCVVIEFPFHEQLAPEDIHVFFGLSDIAALSGGRAGVFSRRVIHRVLEISEKGNLSLATLRKIGVVEISRRNDDASAPAAAKWARDERKRRKLDERQSIDLTELANTWMEREREKTGMTEGDMRDLRDWLADMSPAGWAVISAAPRFRKQKKDE